MGTFAVDVTRVETSTIFVEAGSADQAKEVALEECDAIWVGESRDNQVDGVTELTPEEATKVASYTVRENG